MPYDFVHPNDRNFDAQTNVLTILPDDLVMTPGGYCLSRSAVQSNKVRACPITGDLLNYNLREIPELQKFLASFQIERDELIQQIKGMQILNDEALANARKSIQEFAHKKAAEFHIVKQKRKIIENLKLDSTCDSHLVFWADKTNVCFHGYGGVESRNPYRRIPTRVREMMLIADRVSEYPTVEAFVVALNGVRSHRPNFWNNPFSFVTRDATTNTLYEEKTNLATHRVV